MPMSIRSALIYALLCSCIGACQSNPQTEKNKETLALEKQEEHTQQLQSLINQLQEGDLLLREGTDFSSEQAKSFSVEDKTYSHAGVVCKDGKEWKIIHVVPDHYHIRDKVRIEPIDSFATPVDHRSIGLARYQLSPDQREKFIRYLKRQFDQQVVFDGNFDLETDDAQYCSEMISKGLAFATQDSIQIERVVFKDRTKLKLIKKYYGWGPEKALNKVIIPIDRLYKNPHCNLINQIVYTQ